MTETTCFGCGTNIDVQVDEWWSHSWEENPAKKTVEKAIESKDFRDWFRENKALCPACHKDLITRLLARREANDLGDGGLTEVADLGTEADE